MGTTKPQNPVLNRSHPLTRGLVGAWCFYEGGGTTIHDLSINLNTGETTNNPTWVTGPHGKALNLDGSNQYVSVADDASINFGTDDFSIAVLFRLTEPDGYGQYLVSKNYTTGEPSYALFAQPNGQAAFVIADSTNYRNIQLSNQAFGKWRYVVAVKKSGIIQLYDAFEKQSSDASDLGSLTNTSDLYFATRADLDADRFLKGQLGFVGIYNRGLNESEARQLINDPFCFLRREDKHGAKNSLLLGSQATARTQWTLAQSIADHQWHHVALVRDAYYDKASLYIDGVYQGQYTTDLSAIDLSPNGLIIGQEQDSVGGGFSPSERYVGELDQFIIFNRTLNGSEVLDLAMDRPIPLAQSEYTMNMGAGITLGGAAREHVVAEFMTGGIKTNGSPTLRFTYNISPTGGIKTNGVPVVKGIYNVIPTGGTKLNGTSPEIHNSANSVYGGLRANGSATVTAQYNVTGNGGIKTNGVPTVRFIYKPNQTDIRGGIRLNGSSPEVHNSAKSVFGGLKVGGLLNYTLRYQNVASGGIKLAGLSSPARDSDEAMSGGLALNGTARYFKFSPLHMSGGVMLDSTTTEVFWDYEVMSGGVACRGMTDVNSTGVTEEAMQGGLKLNGVASVFAIYNPDSAIGRWLGAWLYRKKITPFDIPDTLNGFPLLVRFNDAEVGAVAQENGGDIRFTADDGVTSLPYELAYFEIVDGVAYGEFWVKTDLVPNSTDIYMYYGSEGLEDLSSTDAWNSDFLGVWHLDNDSLTMIDSTINANHATGQPAPRSTGITHYAQHYDGVHDYYASAPVADLNPGLGDYTYRCWVYVEADISNNDCPLWCGGHGVPEDPEHEFVTGYNITLGTAPWYASICDGSTYVLVPFSLSSPKNTWLQLAVVIDRVADEARAYINGTLVATASIAALGPISGVEPLTFGAINWRGGRYQNFQGLIDEVRISQVAVTEDWLNYEYRNIAWHNQHWGIQEIPYVSTVANGVGTLTSGFTEEPQGGIALGGEAILTQYDVVEVEGGIALDGESENYTSRSLEMVGGISLNSDATWQWIAGIVIEGSAMLAGEAKVAFYDAYEMLGGIKLGSRAIFTYNIETSGGIKTNGSGRVRSYFADNSTLVTFGGVKHSPYIQDVPWLIGWKYRKQITVQTDNLDANLADFPLYIAVKQDPDLALYAPDNYGYDVRFTSDDGLTLLPFERENYDNYGSYVDANFWVKTDLSTLGTSIYMYYGNTSCVSDASSNSTWKNELKGVWHMVDDANVTVIDSTGNHNGTKKALNEPPQTSAKIYVGQSFDGNDDKITVLSTTSLELTNTGSLEAWIKLDASATGMRGVISKATDWGGFPTISYILYLIDKVPRVYISNGTGSNIAISPSAINDTNWHHIVGTWNGSTIRLYVDGSLSKEDPQTINAQVQSSHPVEIGHGGTGYTMWGVIDEVRIASNANTPEWIKFEYHNVNDTDNELTWGYHEAITYNPEVHYNPAARGGALLDSTTPYFSRFDFQTSGGILADSTSPYSRIIWPVVSGGVDLDGAADWIKINQILVNESGAGVKLDSTSPEMVHKVMWGGLRLNGNATAVHAGQRYWVGNGSNTNWSHTGNWATNSGGTPGASVPTNELVVNFDGNGLGNCVLNVDAYAKSMSMDPSYTGTFSGSTHNLTVVDNATLYGIINMGSGVWTVGGHFDASSSPQFNCDTATLRMTGVRHLVVSGNPVNSHLYKLEISSGALTTLEGGMFPSPKLFIDNRLEVYGGFSALGQTYFGSGADAKLYNTGTIQGSSPYCLEFGPNSLGVTTFEPSGTMGIDILLDDGATVVPGTYPEMVDFLYHGSNELASGFYDFADLRLRATDEDKSIDINASTITVATLTLEATVNNSLIINNYSDWILTGNITTSGDVKWLPHGMRLSLSGTNGQSINFNNSIIDNLYLNKTGGIAQLTGAVRPQSFEGYQGQIDFNGQQLETTNDFTFWYTADIVNTGLPGTVIIVGGNARWIGHPSQILDLDSTADWTFDVAGSAVALDVEVSHSDASTGSTVYAYTSTDHSDNDNWVFAYIYQEVCQGGGLKLSGGARIATDHAYQRVQCYNNQYHCRIPGQDETCIWSLYYRGYGSYVFHRYEGLETQETCGTNITEVTSGCSVALVAPITFCRQFNSLKVTEEELAQSETEPEDEGDMGALSLPEPVFSMAAIPPLTITPETKAANNRLHPQPRTSIPLATPQMAQLHKPRRSKTTITYSNRAPIGELTIHPKKVRPAKEKTKPTGQAL